ncbi:trypsin-like peptidase domain-containing protein [Glycomyces sp. NPDC047369]
MIENFSWLARILDSEGSTAGTGIAIDTSHIITCAHLFDGDNKLTPSVGDHVTVEFPFLDGTLSRIVETTILHYTYEINGNNDFAVLRLNKAMSALDPPRIHLALKFPGRKVQLRGFTEPLEALAPSAEAELSNVSRPGWVQISPENSRGWVVDYGFSGGPVIDKKIDAVIGMVVAKDHHDSGHMLTLEHLSSLWPPLKERIKSPPTLAGEEGSHWSPRARGVSVDSEQGWRFRGRSRALNDLKEVLRRPDQRKVVVVTGSPGVGKSAVLARMVTTSYQPWRVRLPSQDQSVMAEEGSVHCAIHAKGKTALEVAQAILLLGGTHQLESLDDFPSELNLMLSKRDRFNVVIDAIDEAHSHDEARQIITRVVEPIAPFPHTSIVVGTRTHVHSGQLLGIFRAGYDLIDLDNPEYFSIDDLIDYTVSTLSLTGEERRDNPYNNPEVANSVAAAIARASHQNFLIAGLVARSHGLYDTNPANPSQLSYVGTVDDAFREYLRRLEPFDGISADRLLTALAFADAPGFSSEIWAIAFKALEGVDIEAVRLELFAQSAAASFLIESVGSDGLTFRLFHQALIDVSRHWRAGVKDIKEAEARIQSCEERITRAFSDEINKSGWIHAPNYIRRSLASHAGRARILDEMVCDPEFLVFSEPSRLLPLLGQVTSGLAASYAAVYRSNTNLLYRQTLNQRRALLAYNAARFGVLDLAQDLANPKAGETLLLQPKWSISEGIDPRLIARFTGFSGWLADVSCASVQGEVVIVSADNDRESNGHIRLWNLESGQELGSILTKEVADFTSVTCGSLDDIPVAVTTNDRNYHVEVRIWDLLTRQQMGNTMKAPTGRIASMDLISHNDSHLLITGSSSAARSCGEVLVWDLKSRTTIRTLCTIPHADISGLKCVERGGRLLVVAGISYDRGHGRDEVGVWDLYTGEEIRSRTHAHIGGVESIAIASIDDETIVAVGGSDHEDGGEIRLWNLESFEEVGSPLTDPHGSITSVAISQIGDKRVAVTGSRQYFGFRDGALIAWDLDNLTQIGNPLSLPDGGIQSVSCIDFNGTPVAVSHHAGDGLGAIEVWDLATLQEPRELKARQDGQIRAATTCRVEDRDLVLTAGGQYGEDFPGSIQSCDMKTGKAFGVPFSTPHGVIESVATVVVDGTTLAVCGVSERNPKVPISSLLLWEPATGNDVGRIATDHKADIQALACTVIDGHTAAVTGSSTDRRGRGQGEIRTFDLLRRVEFGAPLIAESGCILGIDCTVLEGHPLAASVTGASGDGGVLNIWDLAQRKLVRTISTLKSGPLRAVTCGEIDGRKVVAAAGGAQGFAGEIGIWDLQNGRPICNTFSSPNISFTTLQISRMRDRTTVIAGGANYISRHGIVIAWDFHSGIEIANFMLPHIPFYSALCNQDRLVIGSENTATIFQLQS